MSEVLPPTLHLLFSSVNRQLLALSNSLMLLSRVQGQCKSMCWECQFKSSMIKECHVVWAHALLFCSERWEKILNLNSVHTDNSQYDDECRYVCQFRSIPRFQKSPNYCVMISLERSMCVGDWCICERSMSHSFVKWFLFAIIKVIKSYCAILDCITDDGMGDWVIYITTLCIMVPEN